MEFKKNWELVKKLLNILGNETRVDILRLLSERECYVSEISRELDIGQQAILRHLKLLSDENFLISFEQEEEEEEKRGRGRRRKYYTIKEDSPFKSLFINFSEEQFEVELDQDYAIEAKVQDKIKLFETWPELKEYQDKIKMIDSIESPIDRLKPIIQLINQLQEDYNKYQMPIKYISELLNYLIETKEKIKSLI